MLSSSSGGEDNIINQRNNNSRASSSSSSPFSPSSLLPSPRRKTMEEVWKDISLASLHDHPTREELQGFPRNNNLNTFKATIPQDFLARPFNKDPPTSVASREISLFGSPSPPPATVLSLNSGADFHCLDSTRYTQSNSHASTATASYVSSLNAPFDAFASSSALTSFCKKRVPENDGNTGDRRHKRMIKNRESAARSRARKQAYTNELELEVAHLLEENAKLRKQQQQLYLAAAAQLPKKHTLYRTSTAPF